MKAIISLSLFWTCFFLVLDMESTYVPMWTTTRVQDMKTNDSLGLTPEERALVLAGIEAMDEMGKRTFSHWIEGIGPALKMLQSKPGGANRKRFKTMREEAGFGKIDGAVV